jgi:flagellar motor switch protein FliM
MQASEQTLGGAQRKGQDPLLDQSGFAVERLPMLRVVFDRLTASLVEGLRLLSRAPATFSVDAIAPGGLFETLAASKGAICAVLHSPELDCRALVAFDRSFVFSLTQVLLGAEGADADEPPNRPFTKIETNLVRKISDLAARSLRDAFAGLLEASFALERQELLIDTGILGRRDAAIVKAAIRFQALGMGGTMTVAIPQTALQPIRQKLSRDLPSESATDDPQWARQMRNEVSSAEILVKGILEEMPMTLGEVAAIEVGQVLKLEGSGMGRVRLECGEHDLFWCKLAQVDGRYTLEIEEPIVEERSILEDMIAH